MKNKRGQVTIFIILAIVIMVSVSLFFLFKDSKKLENSSIDSGGVSIYVQSCIERTGPFVLYELGESGGYFFLPEESTLEEIPYYYFNNESIIPSLEKLEMEISEYSEFTLKSCLDNFDSFNDFEIETGELEIMTKIENEKVIFNVNYPLTITLGGEIALLGDFGKYEFSVRLSEIHFVIEKIVSDFEIMENICLSCLADLAKEHDLKIGIETPYDEIMIFTIKDESTQLGEFPFEFSFAVENEL